MRSNGLFARDQLLAHHLDRDLERCLRRALARAALQHEELAVFDGEFDVLHVAVMRFELVACGLQLGKRLGHHLFERRRFAALLFSRLLGDLLWRADTRNDVFALRIDEILAVKRLLACRWVARERNARGRALAHIAEHHRLHIDGGAPACGNIVQLAIGDCARIHPRAEYSADRAPQLLFGILRKRLAAFDLDGLLITPNNVFPFVSGKLGVERIARFFFHRFEDLLERVMRKLQNDIGIHLNEAAIGIISKARIARELGQAFDR